MRRVRVRAVGFAAGVVCSLAASDFAADFAAGLGLAVAFVEVFAVVFLAAGFLAAVVFLAAGFLAGAALEAVVFAAASSLSEDAAAALAPAEFFSVGFFSRCGAPAHTLPSDYVTHQVAAQPFPPVLPPRFLSLPVPGWTVFAPLLQLPLGWQYRQAPGFSYQF